MKYLNAIFLVVFACSESGSAVSVSEGLPQGVVLTNYEDGSGLQKALVNINGSIVQEGDVLNNKKHGSWIIYTNSGQLQTISTYNQGIKQGTETQYDAQGFITSLTNYAGGNMHGECKWFKRGKVIQLKRYHKGQLNGIQEKYYPNGNIQEKMNYVNGKIDGEATWYNQEGEETIRYTYNMGELVDDGKNEK